MDFRFIAAGILAGAIGFVGGSTVFADASHPSDPTIAGLATERQAADAAASVALPRPAKLPALPKPPKAPKISLAVARRVIVVHLPARRTTKRTVTQHKATPKPKQVVTHKSETETHHESDTHQDDHGQDD
jgi:hypothetical protein